MPCGLQDQLTVVYPFAVSTYSNRGIVGIRVLDFMTGDMKFKFLSNELDFRALEGF